jgi:hypothetical protein
VCRRSGPDHCHGTNALIPPAPFHRRRRRLVALYACIRMAP